MQTESTPNSSSRPISFERSSDPMEDFSFKPLTKGLGFHNKDKAQRPPSVKKVPKKTTDLSLQNNPTLETLPGGDLIQGLEAIYKNPPRRKVQAPPKRIKKTQALKEANIFNQATAFFMDLLIIMSAFLILNSAFLLMIKGGLSAYELNLFVQEHLFFELPLFAIFFIIYFALLDPIRTPGKLSMGIETRLIDGSSLEIRNSAVRAFYTLGSMMLLGLPTVSEWTDKLSATKVFQSPPQK